MENPKTFSHGLLYSIPPENFSSLHLQDEGITRDFEWSEFQHNIFFCANSEAFVFLFEASTRRWHNIKALNRTVGKALL